MEPAGLYDLPPTAISRELFFNVGGPHGFMRWGIYLFLLIVLLFLAYTLWNRVKGTVNLRGSRPVFGF